MLKFRKCSETQFFQRHHLPLHILEDHYTPGNSSDFVIAKSILAYLSSFFSSRRKKWVYYHIWHFLGVPLSIAIITTLITRGPESERCEVSPSFLPQHWQLVTTTHYFCFRPAVPLDGLDDHGIISNFASKVTSSPYSNRKKKEKRRLNLDYSPFEGRGNKLSDRTAKFEIQNTETYYYYRSPR